MNLTKKLIKTTLTFGLFAATNVASAFELSNEIDFLTGWRTDKVQATVHTYDVKGGEVINVHQDNASDLNTWQFGVRGVWALPNLHDSCWCDGYVDPNNLYVRGSALWGWGTGGPYKQHITTCETRDRCAKARNVNTQDYDVALGWFIPASCYFGLAPVVGWNYDNLEYTARHFPCNWSEANGTKISSKFSGPYVGVDLALNYCSWLVAAGYEYHWVTCWRSNYIVPGDYINTANYWTNSRRAHCGFGDVAHADIIWSWCEWDIGVNFKYRYFRANHGRGRIPASICDTGGNPYEPHYTKTSGRWRNYEVNLVLGTRF